MKIRSLVTVSVVGFALACSTGCAVFTKGRTQMVVVRSSPSGAVTTIDGIEVGTTPLKIKLPRSTPHSIVAAKPGFERSAAVVLPTASDYEKRFLRWGIDYDLGAAVDLTPGELNIPLTPAVPSDLNGNRYEEMSYRVLQADALLAAREISSDDHRYIVKKIVEFYTN